MKRLALVICFSFIAAGHAADRNCQGEGRFFHGKVYRNSNFEIVHKELGRETNCIQESGQFQLQGSLCGHDELMVTQGWHTSDGRVAGELRYDCIHQLEFNL